MMWSLGGAYVNSMIPTPTYDLILLLIAPLCSHQEDHMLLGLLEPAFLVILDA